MNNPGKGPHYPGYNHSGVAVQWLPVQYDPSQIGTPCLPEIGDLLTSHVRKDDDRGNHLVRDYLLDKSWPTCNNSPMIRLTTCFSLVSGTRQSESSVEY